MHWIYLLRRHSVQFDCSKCSESISRRWCHAIDNHFYRLSNSLNDARTKNHFVSIEDNNVSDIYSYGFLDSLCRIEPQWTKECCEATNPTGEPNFVSTSIDRARVELYLKKNIHHTLTNGFIFMHHFFQVMHFMCRFERRTADVKRRHRHCDYCANLIAK